AMLLGECAHELIAGQAIASMRGVWEPCGEVEDVHGAMDRRPLAAPPDASSRHSEAIVASTLSIANRDIARSRPAAASEAANPGNSISPATASPSSSGVGASR